MRREEFFIELDLSRKMWLAYWSYNPKYSLISHHLNKTGKYLDVLTSKFDKIILMGHFNAEPTDTSLFDFCEIYNLNNKVKDNTCFKNPNRPTCIDLIITNKPKIPNFCCY